MQKQIHVNSYVKRDGTQVKEHYRNIDIADSGTLIILMNVMKYIQTK